MNVVIMESSNIEAYLLGREADRRGLCIFYLSAVLSSSRRSLVQWEKYWLEAGRAGYHEAGTSYRHELGRTGKYFRQMHRRWTVKEYITNSKGGFHKNSCIRVNVPGSIGPTMRKLRQAKIFKRIWKEKASHFGRYNIPDSRTESIHLGYAAVGFVILMHHLLIPIIANVTER